MSVSISRRRAAFTLVELLVVIAIIGVLVALLLPAVQAARESARRMQCSNNLKQMALAFHNHQDTKSYLPGAARDGHPAYDSISFCCRAKTHAGFSWLYQILPFVEQNNIYDLASSADTTTNNYNPQENAVAGSPVSFFNCPSRRPPTEFSGIYRADYAGNAGERSTSVGMRSGAPSNGARGTVRQIDSNSWKLTIERIKDGSSNTLLLGEKALHPTAWGSEGGDNERWSNPGYDEDIVRFGAILSGSIMDGLPPIPDNKSTAPERGWKADPSVPHSNLFGQWHPWFGSSHPGGVNFALGDGSVRFIPFNVDAPTFRRMAISNDGEPVTLP